MLSSFSSPTAGRLRQDGIRFCSYSLFTYPTLQKSVTCLTRLFRGKCWAPAPNGWFIMSYIGTSIQVATDWVVAITPFFIVRNLQMNQRKKISVCAILGLGVLASFAAMMRIAMYPQTDERYHLKDNLGKYTSSLLPSVQLLNNRQSRKPSSSSGRISRAALGLLPATYRL